MDTFITTNCFTPLCAGGRGKDGAPIITFPEYSGFSDLVPEDFQNVVTYLTSIPRYSRSNAFKAFFPTMHIHPWLSDQYRTFGALYFPTVENTVENRGLVLNL